MLKTIYRIFFILLAVALVAGALYLFFNTPAGQALVSSRGGGFDGGPRFNPSASATFFDPAAGSATGFQRDFGGSAFSTLALFDLFKNAAIIGLITVGVVLLRRRTPRTITNPANQ